MSRKRRKAFSCFIILLVNSVNSLPLHIDAPSLAVSNSSLEAIGIANKINQFFNPNSAGGEVSEVNVEPLGDPMLGKSMIKLNLNMNLEIENGQPQKMTLPQGDLMLMFVPNRNQVSEYQMERFMTKTTNPTSTSLTPNGGVLFTSWLEKEDKDYKSPIMARSDSLPAAISNDQDFNDISSEELIEGIHEQITNDNDIRQSWNKGQVPQFPNYHNIPTKKIKTNMEIKQDLLNQKTNQLANLLKDFKKKYRIDDEPDYSTDFDFGPHMNNNNVIAGGLTRPVGSSTSSVECSEINGETVCRRRTTSCDNSFGAGCQDNNIVPFSPPQVSMNQATSTTRRPQLPVFFSTTRRPQTTALTTSTTTLPPLPDLDEQAVIDRVMNMDVNEVREAFMDPMMIALGSMITMAGAYMAIVMQEQAAASAFALAAAGKKKKRK